MTKRAFQLIIVLLAFVACQGNKNKMHLSGTCDEGVSGSYVYLYDEEIQKNVDSVVVENGAFSFERAIGNPRFFRLVSDLSTVVFIAEDSVLNVAMKSGEDAYVRGSRLNDEFAEELQSLQKIQDEFLGEFQTVVADSTLEDEERAIKQKKLGEEMHLRIKEHFKEEFPLHLNDPIGVFLLMLNEYSLSKSEFIAAYEQAGPAVKENRHFKESIQRLKGESALEIGDAFIDFKGVNPQDTTQSVALSEYVAKGNYVIVDFWASWCGPCKKEIPNLANIYKKYHAKGLDIVGVAIGDKLEDHQNACEVLGVEWPQIFDKNDAGAAVYKIKRIPYIILLDEEGKIVAKNIRGVNLEAKVAELFDKK